MNKVSLSMQYCKAIRTGQCCLFFPVSQNLHTHVVTVRVGGETSGLCSDNISHAGVIWSAVGSLSIIKSRSTREHLLKGGVSFPVYWIASSNPTFLTIQKLDPVPFQLSPTTQPSLHIGFYSLCHSYRTHTGLNYKHTQDL